LKAAKKPFMNLREERLPIEISERLFKANVPPLIVATALFRRAIKPKKFTSGKLKLIPFCTVVIDPRLKTTEDGGWFPVNVNVFASTETKVGRKLIVVPLGRNRVKSLSITMLLEMLTCGHAQASIVIVTENRVDTLH
jgi:hypothetical protein